MNTSLVINNDRKLALNAMLLHTMIDSDLCMCFSLLLHNLLERLDTYLWSKRPSTLPPQVSDRQVFTYLWSKRPSTLPPQVSDGQVYTYR